MIKKLIFGWQFGAEDAWKREVVHVDAEQVTSCCFFKDGPERNTLFITTAELGLNGQYDGCLFTCKVDANGLGPDYVEISEGCTNC